MNHLLDIVCQRQRILHLLYDSFFLVTKIYISLHLYILRISLTCYGSLFMMFKSHIRVHSNISFPVTFAANNYITYSRMYVSPLVLIAQCYSFGLNINVKTLKIEFWM